METTARIKVVGVPKDFGCLPEVFENNTGYRVEKMEREGNDVIVTYNLATSRVGGGKSDLGNIQQMEKINFGSFQK